MGLCTASCPRTGSRCVAAVARRAARRGPSAEQNMTAGRADLAQASLARAGLRVGIGVPAPGAATITLDRSERRNAMTPGMWHGLAAIGRALPPEVRVEIGRAH